MHYSSLRKMIEDMFASNSRDRLFNFDFDEYLDSLRATIAERRKNQKSFKLYRFSGADYWNIRNLECEQLILSNVGKMNDVFEGVMSEPGYYIQPDDNEALGELISLKCFSEDWKNLLMWAHYADKYFGICVEYDLTLLSDDDYVFSYLYPVLYKENRRQIGHFIKISASELRGFKASQLLRDEPSDVNSMNDVISWYLEKSNEWAYEKEWRIIVPFFDRFAAEHSTDGRYSHNVYENGIIPFGCATAVFLGTRTRKVVEDHVLEIANRINDKRGCVKTHMKVYRTFVHETEYKLSANPI